MSSEMSSDSIISANGVCAPSAMPNMKRFGSCMPPKYMRKIGELYNKHKEQEGKGSEVISQDIMKSPSVLKQELDRRFQCRNEKCWLEQNVVRQKLDLVHKLDMLYRPKMPESWKVNSHEWLSDDDIRKVMKQYEALYKHFGFMGVFPIDFKEKDVCTLYKVCAFNVFDFLASGKKELGLVLNLDKHTGSGSHWVAVFVSLNPKSSKFGMCFYDSGGVLPPQHTVNFLKEIREDARLYFKDSVPNFDKRFKTQYNVKKHQVKNTECGMFSMLFLIACLEHKSADYNKICNMMKERWDEEAHTYRKRLFISS